MSRTRALSLVALSCCLALPLVADPGQPEARTVDQQSGFTVAVDRESGALRAPTAAEAALLMKELRQLLNHSDEAVEIVTLPTGAQRMRLDDRFLNVVIAVGQVEGDLHNECVSNLAQAETIVAAAMAAAGQE